jgi:ABC-2 type transport system permease protein
MVPALVRLAVAALSPVEITVEEPAEYFIYIQIILALFCAVAAPEVFGRDERYRILPLYFSRALARVDYALAKLAALAVALFIVLVLPQVILVLGNAVSTQDVTGYLADNLDLVPPIFASSVLVAFVMASIGLATASQTSRRAFSTGAVIIFFVVLTSLGNILAETTTGDAQRYSLLLSPIAVLDGAVHWLFSAEPAFDSYLAESGISLGLCVLVALGYAAVALAVLYRRLGRLNV